MRIKRLVLENFRAFENAEIHFDDRLSVIVGNNSSGKSTIIDALSIALSPFVSEFAYKGNNRRIMHEDVRFVEEKVGSNIDMQPVYPASVGVDVEFESKELSWSRSLRSIKSHKNSGDIHDLQLLAKYMTDKLILNNASITLPFISYYGTGRLWAKKRDSQDKKKEQYKRQSGYIDCLSNETNEHLMNNWLLNMNLNAFSRKEELPELNAVYRAVRKCFEGVTGSNDVSVDFDSNAMRLQISYTDSNGKHATYPMSTLSDGYKNTISLIADIASRMAMLNPHLGDDILNTPGIVMIDEVDLHLHPRWQARIIGDLVSIFPNIQFIVTTHAPIVINSVRKENLIILSEGHVVGESSFEIYGRDISSILSQVMGVNERPEILADKLAEFHKLVDMEDYDGAERLLDEIDKVTGSADPEIQVLKTRLFFLKRSSGK